MGQAGSYRCQECDHVFSSRAGGGFFFTELRCERCDSIKRVKIRDWPSDADLKNNPDTGRKAKFANRAAMDRARDEFVCEECFGQLRDDLGPMCPICRSRDVKMERVTMFYD